MGWQEDAAEVGNTVAQGMWAPWKVMFDLPRSVNDQARAVREGEEAAQASESGGPPPEGVQPHEGWSEAYGGAYGDGGGGGGTSASIDVRSMYGPSPYDAAYRAAMQAMAKQRIESDARISGIYNTSAQAHQKSTPEVQALMESARSGANSAYQQANENVRAAQGAANAQLAASAANKGIAGHPEAASGANQAAQMTTNRMSSEQAAGQQRFSDNMASMAQYHDTYGKGLSSLSARDRARLEGMAAMKQAEMELGLAHANAEREDRINQLQVQAALAQQGINANLSAAQPLGAAQAQRSKLLAAGQLANQIWDLGGYTPKDGDPKKRGDKLDLGSYDAKEAWLASQGLDVADPYVQSFLRYWHAGNNPSTFPYEG